MGQIATGAGEVVTGAAMLPVHPYGGAHTIRSGVTDIRAGLAKRKVGTPSKVVRPAEPHRVGFDEPVPPSLGDTAFGRAPAQPRILKGTPEPWVEMGQKPPPVAPLPSASQARQAGRFEAPPTPVIAGEPRILKATKAQPAPAPPAYPLEDLTSTLRNLDMDAKKAKGLAEIARSKYPQDFDAAVRWATGKPKPTSSAGAAPVARPPASERLPEQPRASVQATGDVEMTPLEPTARSRGEKPGQQTMGLSSESYASASRGPRVVDFAKTLHEEGISELSTVNEQSWVIVSDMVRAQKMADVVTELVAEGVPEGLASEFAERLVKPVKPPTNQVTLDLIARELERRQKMLPIRRKPG